MSHKYEDYNVQQKELMKFTKKELCKFVEIAMIDKNHFEHLYNNLAIEYDGLLNWKNEIKSRLTKTEMDKWAESLPLNSSKMESVDLENIKLDGTFIHLG